jgi:hypothetical protein
VRWLQGNAATHFPLRVELAVMSGNAAQAFLDDNDWARTLGAAHAALNLGGHRMFEVRNPDRQAWREWNREPSCRLLVRPEGGAVATWVALNHVNLYHVSFRWTFVLVEDGAVLTSSSTLRFRGQEEIRASLPAAGFTAVQVREAPDLPGGELVFISTPAPVHDDGKRGAT